MTSLLPVAAALLAYLVGSLSFAVLVSRALGLNDPRSYGSGNPGATNVLRSGHKGAAVLTLLLDSLKGAIPVLVVQRFGAGFGLPEASAVWVGVAAFMGHLWPVFFRFQGGKGVATAGGVLLALNPALGLLTLATWLLVAAAFRYSSLAALAAALASPLCQMIFWPASPGIWGLVLMSALLIWRHRSNIEKLCAGTERKLGPPPSTHQERTPL